MKYTQKLFKTIRYTCLLAVIVLGFVTIVGTGSSSDSGSSNGNDNRFENGTSNGNGNVDNGIGNGDNNGSIHEDTFTNSIGMTFNYIKPSTFIMGSPEDEPGRWDDETQHKVTLTHGYHMQTTPVTQGQWVSVMGSNPSYFSNCGSSCPVENVSWIDAQVFISALNALEVTDRYALPTEAQWEYAARAGSTTAFANGDITQYADMRDCNFDRNLDAIGWYCFNSNSRTHPVGQKAANAWGLYDMHGNVWEWVADWYGTYPTAAVTAPTGPTSGADRVRRGGSYVRTAKYSRSANRNSYDPGDWDGSSGFRLVLLPGH